MFFKRQKLAKNVLFHKQHPAYKDGSQILEARADYSEAASRLRELEQMMVNAGMVGADFKRTVGRKPTDKQSKLRKD